MQNNELIIEPVPELSSAETAGLIASQNDSFRKAALGVRIDGPVPMGRVVMTAGIAAQSEAFRAALIHAVVAYDDFNPDCDPHGWHEMGVVEIEGEKVWFKIDLYDQAYEYGSSDPTDPRFTRRVLTLLFPSEY